MDRIYIDKYDLPDSVRLKYFDGVDRISIEDLIYTIDELYSELEKLQEDFDDYKQEVNDNYKFVGQAEQIGYNENW